MVKKNARSKKIVIRFGKYHDEVKLGQDIKELHELTEEERELLVRDFNRLKGIEKEEITELSAVRHFEQRLQSLIESVVYLEGYIQEIEEGHEMLRINPSVKELGAKLSANIKDVEKLSASMLSREKKMLGLAKHVNKILSKAKRYERVIFG
jgi:hypothetical protein